LEPVQIHGMVRRVVELAPLEANLSSGGAARQRPNRSERRISPYKCISPLSKSPSPTRHLSPLRRPAMGLSSAFSEVTLATTARWRRFPSRLPRAAADVATDAISANTLSLAVSSETAGCIAQPAASSETAVCSTQHVNRDQKGRLEHACDIGRVQASWSIGHQSVDEWREATVADFLKRPSTVPTKGLTLSSSLHALPRHAIRPATSQQRGSDKAATRQLPQLLPETVPFPQELPSATTAEGISLHRVPRHARKATRRDQLRRVESLPMTKRDQPPKLESLSLTKGNEPRILKPLSPVLSDARKHVLRNVRLKPEYAWLASDV